MAPSKKKAEAPAKASTKTKATSRKPLKNKKKKEPKKLGRKPWVPDLDNIERWAMQGMDDKDIAALSGISAQGFCTKKSELPELKDALDRGRAKGVQIASGKLLELVLGKDRDAIKFYLERKGGWKQTNVIEKKKSIEDMTDEELLEALQRATTNGI